MQQYVLVTNNTTAAQSAMQPNGQAQLVFSGANWLIWLWTNSTADDATTLQALFDLGNVIVSGVLLPTVSA